MVDLDLEKVKTRIAQLRAEINHHNYRYYVLDSPEISDMQPIRRVALVILIK